MGTDSVLKGLAIHRCGEVYCDKTAERDGFVFYDFHTREVYGLSEEAVPAKKQVRGVDGASTTVTLATVPARSREDVSRLGLASIRQSYDDYRRREGDRGETGRAGAGGGVDLDALSREELSWAEAEDAEGVTEEVLLATCSLVSTIGYDMTVSKKEYVELLRSLASEVQWKRSECEATT